MLSFGLNYKFGLTTPLWAAMRNVLFYIANNGYLMNHYAINFVNVNWNFFYNDKFGPLIRPPYLRGYLKFLMGQLAHGKGNHAGLSLSPSTVTSK